MEKKLILGALSLISFASILFTPTGSNIWIYFFIAGIVFGIGSFMNRK